MRGPWSALPLVLAGIALSAPLLAARPAAGSSFGEPGERLDGRTVEVFAAVTDRAGERVSGLTADDFRLSIDGREVPFDAFTAVIEGQSREGAPAGAEPATAATAVSRNFLVFVDNGFSVATERDQLLATLAGQLSLLGPDDRMAIVAFDGDHLAVLADWTANRATLAAAFHRAEGQPADGARGLAVRPEPRNPGGVRALVRGMPRVVAAVDAALRTLPAPPGRRIALLLSGGWPLGGDPALLWPLTATADRLGYTFYPVDVSGLSPERGAPHGLELLARATGGQAIVHSARLTALALAADDTRFYYRLGFSPLLKADDREHEIRVEVRRPGLEVRARKSYIDLSATAEGALEQQSQEIAGPARDGGPARDLSSLDSLSTGGN